MRVLTILLFILLAAELPAAPAVAQTSPAEIQRLIRSAQSGNAAAQTNLGIMYEAGIGTETSDSQAEYWYRRAAEAGLRDGQYQLGAILAADMLRGIMAKKVDEQNFSERVLE